MITGEIIGHLGADAKETKINERTVISFNVSSTYKNNLGEEKTTWISCFLNRSSKVIDYLKKGTKVYVSGDLFIDVFKKDDETVIPSIKINVSKLELLSKKA